MVSQHLLKFPLYVPRIIQLLDNWPLYVWNYALRRHRPAEYRFRSGHRLIDATGTLAGTIAVVFIREEYGRPPAVGTLLDVGANMGAFTVFAASTGPKLKIHSFEPDDRNFRYLKWNVDVNGFTDRVQLNNCAVAAQSGARDLLLGESPVNSIVIKNQSGLSQTVTCKSILEILDSEKISAADFFKLNCEGAEYEVLHNFPTDSFYRIPDIRLEYHNLNNAEMNGDALARFLKGKGYSIERYTNYLNVSGFIWARFNKNR